MQIIEKSVTIADLVKMIMYCTGGMQDYNYIWAGCMEITIEMSCCKYPSAVDLPKYWRDNKKSLITMLGEAHRGEFYKTLHMELKLQI